jgi:hypothetical protein
VIELLERPSAKTPSRLSPSSDERAARRSLQAQVERLDRELAQLLADAWPRQGLRWIGEPAGRPRRPRILDLGELERTRDALAFRVQDARDELDARKQVEDANRQLVQDMLRNPRAHRWERVSHADIGEPGCHHWHVLPRWGVVGILTNWWRVKISSGCPLSTSR